MTKRAKSRVGFVVIKLLVNGHPFFLLRRNEKWKDISLLGGHEKDRDKSNLHKTARRELWEEVPSIRKIKTFNLEPLTDELSYGPVYSRSKSREVEYQVQFFLLRFDDAPIGLIKDLGQRTRNILVSQDHLIAPNGGKLSGMVKLLNNVVSGGLAGVPLSSSFDVGPFLPQAKQLELGLK